MSGRRKSNVKHETNILDSRRQSRSGSLDPTLFENPFDQKPPSSQSQNLFTASAESNSSSRQPRALDQEPSGVTYAVAELPEEQQPVIPTADVVYNDVSNSNSSNALGGIKPLDRKGVSGDDRNQQRREKKGFSTYEHSKGAVQGTEEGIANWPASLRNQLLNTFQTVPNTAKASALLASYQWPDGIQETIFKSCRKIAMRFFILDDSGSMILNDGNRVVSHGKQTKMIRCTRWAELSDTMEFLANLSEALHAPSEFRLLNGADPIIVGLGDDDGESLKFFKEVLQESPAGPTPLCLHISAIVRSIQSIAPQLKANNQKVAVVIATDGESSDGNVADALRPLTNLPVLVILRLCTAETQVVEYWNNIDNQLELDIDVIDDQLGDAKQVDEFNGWLTYGEPLHRMREFGASMKELDIIDESTISVEQMRMICAYLFTGGNPKELPHPGVDFPAFLAKVKQLNGTVPKVFCPISKTLKPWIDPQRLQKYYAGEYTNTSSSCCIT